MFKSWRSDKKKIKAVFMLQFQATQVPPLKKPALTISLVPEDVGKTTFKLEKAAVRDGTCSWDNPIYVSVKLIGEPKSGKLHEKIYHFVVSNGSSKSGYLGEASIDFADFAQETEPLTVSLPLKFANSGAVLHVTIAKVQGGFEQRQIEDSEDSKLHSASSLKNQPSNGHIDGNDFTLTENIERDGSFDGSIGSHMDFQSTSRENSMPCKETKDTTKMKNRLHRPSSTDWSMGSNSDESLVDLANSPEDNLPREFQEASDESIEQLKSQISSLMRQSEISELELQTLRKQIAKESRKGQDLSRQIIDLKVERDALRIECDQLKSLHRSVDERESLNQLLVENEDFKVRLEEIERELGHEKELNTDLKMQLEKTQDSNSELILAVRDLDEMLEQKDKEISSLSDKLVLTKCVEEVREDKCKCKLKDDGDQQALPASQVLPMEKIDASELHSLKQKIIDLSDEIEEHRENREKLENYIEQLTSDYEALKQENQNISLELEQSQLQELKMQNEFSGALTTIKTLELHIQTMEEKFKKQTQELSESLVSINALESQVKGLEEDLEKQTQGFEHDLDAMTRVKIEQEHRAIRAEEALRKTRWKNAIRAEQLQEEFKRLSVEMAGRLDDNEKTASKAVTEVNELQVQKGILEQTIQQANKELASIKDQNRVKVEELSAQLELKTKDMHQMSLQLEDRSKQLAYQMKLKEEMRETFALEIQSLKANIESLRKAKNGISKDENLESTNGTEITKISLEETKTERERCSSEGNKVDDRCMLKMEAEKTQMELLVLRSLKDEMDTKLDDLLSKLQSLEAQNTDLNHRILEEKMEKEKLQKQVLEYERKVSSEQESKVSNFDRMDEHRLAELLNGMALVKERNRVMETELKEMQERYSEISLRFAEVEGERQQLVMTVRNLKNSKKN
ncbi:hypothetical protein Tsubulata_043781 [Turnera subulata]|uniref:C2 NT-type domain-containing protein n=2 Tax=Turnera subulata TaxID=218843 RepID=A0A9Q0G3P7_9ROSI|nr:hypothetical protein Tsubulata_043781 [Turnera subulata]